MRHLHERNLSIERRLGDGVRARLPGVFGEFVMFVFKQAWACLFGGLLLAMIIGTKLVWSPDWAFQRYDFLFLFAATLILYARTRVWFTNTEHPRWMPLPLAAFLSSFALWVVENVGTATGTWLYSGQMPGQAVNLAKLGSWYLLLYVAFVTVTVVSRAALSAAPVASIETRAKSALRSTAPPPPEG